MRSEVERFAAQLQAEQQQEVFDAQAEVTRLKDHLDEVEGEVQRLAAAQRGGSTTRVLSSAPGSVSSGMGSVTSADDSGVRRQLEAAVRDMQILQVCGSPLHIYVFAHCDCWIARLLLKLLFLLFL